MARRGKKSHREVLRRQTCKICGYHDKFDFRVPDDLWKKIVPAGYENKAICLACFDDLAFEKQIDYFQSLEVLYFAGNQAMFKFQPVSAHSG
jgi:hypothetical protein